MIGEQRKLWKGLIFAVLFVTFAFVSVGCAANTYTVCPGGGCDYTSIQAAIDNATSGDTIEVHSGTYYENVNVNRQLSLRGVDTGGGKPFVDGCCTGSAIMLSHDGIVLDGFTAINASGYPMAGILVYSNNNLVINNTASSNNYTGIYLSFSSNNTLVGNTANSNNYDGILLDFSSNNTLVGNTANSNDWNGILLRSSSNNNTLTGNTANSNNYDGIYLSGLDNNTLMGNTVNSNHRFGFRLSESSNNTLTGNTANSSNIGIYLDSSNDNLIYNNYFDNTNNAQDNGNNIWNISKTLGTNIIGGPYLGGNYWSDYVGDDTNGDGLGDTLTPYNSSGNITFGGDWLPLVMVEEAAYTNIDVGVTSNISLANSSDLIAYLPPEYDDMDISDAVVLNVDVTDDTPGNPADDAYTDITINVGSMNIATCKVFKAGVQSRFLPEVPDVTELPTVDGEPAFSRDLGNNTVTIRLYVGDPLLGVLPAPGFELELASGYNMISIPLNDSSVITASDLAAKIGTSCTEVVRWDGASQAYVSHIPGLPLNDFATAAGEGYFVNVNNPTSVTFEGPGWTSPCVVALTSGYNMIGVPVNDSSVTTASTLAAKIGTGCTEVVRWDGDTQSYISHIPGLPLNDFTITGGQGYFVNVNNPIDVSFEGITWED